MTHDVLVENYGIDRINEKMTLINIKGITEHYCVTTEYHNI